MPIIDLHCDVLSKLLQHPNERFYNSQLLDVTLEQLQQADYLLQVFAIYIPERAPKTIDTFLRCVDLFYTKILAYPNVHVVHTKEDLQYCLRHNKIGAMLSIEGIDCLEAKLYMSSIIEKLGVRALGLTWNNENWAAEGVLAQTNRGISPLGQQFIMKLSNQNTIIDVSHLSPKSFEDLFQLYSGPIWASHSNSYSMCDHARNLSDTQIMQLIKRNSIIGLTYVPQFISSSKLCNIDDLIKHIDYMLQLGAGNQLALGSDFDGIDAYVEHLNRPIDVQKLEKKLLHQYGEHITENIMWRNAYQFLERNLL